MRRRRQYENMVSALADACTAEMKKSQEIETSKDDEFVFDHDATFENDCGENDKRVRDHDRRTGKYRGCAYDRCNLLCFSIPFVFFPYYQRVR